MRLRPRFPDQDVLSVKRAGDKIGCRLPDVPVALSRFEGSGPAERMVHPVQRGTAPRQSPFQAWSSSVGRNRRQLGSRESEGQLARAARFGATTRNQSLRNGSSILYRLRIPNRESDPNGVPRRNSPNSTSDAMGPERLDAGRPRRPAISLSRRAPPPIASRADAERWLAAVRREGGGPGRGARDRTGRIPTHPMRHPDCCRTAQRAPSI